MGLVFWGGILLAFGDLMVGGIYDWDLGWVIDAFMIFFFSFRVGMKLAGGFDSMPGGLVPPLCVTIP